MKEIRFMGANLNVASQLAVDPNVKSWTATSAFCMNCGTNYWFTDGDEITHDVDLCNGILVRLVLES